MSFNSVSMERQFTQKEGRPYQENPLDLLVHTAVSFIPILEGDILFTPEDNAILSLSAGEPEKSLTILHSTLKQAHPEAGAPYWRVRCWGLVCWQPLYLALICVYQLKSVPLNLQHLVQRQQNTMVAGYQLAPGQWQTGAQGDLIQMVCQSLSIMFKTLQDAHLALFGGKPVLYQTLLADQLLASLLVAGKLLPECDEAAMTTDFRHWAEALKLPLTPLKGLQVSADQTTQFVRQSCCLHFRRDDGALCSDCPRQKTKNHKKVN
ncbi:siderophore ferric iron reductase [Marinomonas pollencensis]|uniref:Siderophore ferric iron reductase n=1 Tax=Marinomonas pollencensis TaxID=491954 RepID=A0A3E0DMG8_9GAMM|nr:siderophore ferric iron reductase [Marinomonas pollencensis]REG83857.1 siderophore ferric iron reductase [Marinomonas pollencensis]